MCIRCVPPCETCVVNPYICTSCSPGSSLSGWNCLSNFYFQFTVTLNTTLPVFYNNYQAFLTAILVPLSTKNLQTFTIFSITSGSVVVNGGISTTTTSNSNAAGT